MQVVDRRAEIVRCLVANVDRSGHDRFQLVKRRWVVERTFGWLMRYRRLARDYERTIAHHEAMLYWATVMIMTRRLACYETGEPAPPRWGGDRKPSPPAIEPAAITPLSTGS
jgi:hypothetical protein